MRNLIHLIRDYTISELIIFRYFLIWCVRFVQGKKKIPSKAMDVAKTSGEERSIYAIFYRCFLKNKKQNDQHLFNPWVTTQISYEDFLFHPCCHGRNTTSCLAISNSSLSFNLVFILLFYNVELNISPRS